MTGSSIGTAASWLRPSNYLGPFEWWNYFVAIERLPDDRFRQLASLSAFGCIVVLCLSFAIETRRPDLSPVAERYVVALLAVLLTFVPLVADGFSMRQHIYIACVPAIVLTVGYAVAVIVESLPRMARPPLSAAALAALCVLGLGAHAGFERALIQPTARAYSFARQMARGGANRNFTRVAIVIPRQQCSQEPCRGMFAYRMPWADPEGLADSHRKIVQDETGRSDFDVEFVASADASGKDAGTTLWIDYRDIERAEPTKLD